MIVLAFGNDNYGTEFWGKGYTPKDALDSLMSMDEDIDMSSVVFYKAEEMNLRVDTNPVIVSKD